MTAKALADYITASKYCLKINGKKETHEQSIDRMLNMHRVKYAAFPAVLRELDRVRDALVRGEISGSQRARQFGGEAILKKNARLYNCAYTHCDRVRMFAEAFWLSLCGTGCGFSVQARHVSKLPPIQRGLSGCRHVVADTIEGWADALHALMQHHFENGPLPEFDFSMIRPKGVPLSSGGLAPGPEPLRVALGRIDALLNDLAEGERLKPIHAFDVLMHASDAVLSGGVRRSAMIALFDKDDVDMLNAKPDKYWEFAPQRARANISAVAIGGTLEEDEIRGILELSRAQGEPGLLIGRDLNHGTNPCGEISLRGETADGRSAWQFCNLASVNVSSCESEFDLQLRCDKAAFLATLQAGYTDFGYLGKASEDLTREEALIGVSLCGVQDRPELGLNPALLTHCAQLVRIGNAAWAEEIGIRMAARCTTVKPEGTNSLCLQAAAGAHARFARHYIRRVREKANNPVALQFQRVNPHAVKPDPHDPDGRILEFAISAPEGARIQKEQSALEQLEVYYTLRKYWVLPGSRSPDLGNNVSFTVAVKDEEWDDVARWVYDHQTEVGGISFLPHNETVYVNPPHEEVLPDNPRFQELLMFTLPVDYSDVDHMPEIEQDPACAGGSCEII